MEAELTYQGNDDQILIRAWQDKAKTIPVSIDDLDDLEVRITVGNNILGRWNKAGGGVFTALTRIDQYNYWFYFRTDEDTKRGKADLWVETIDGTETGIGVKRDIFNIQEKNY